MPGSLRLRTIVTIGFVMLLLSPLVGSRDGFPLSTYPMYATARGPEATFVVAVGVSAAGDRVALSTPVVAGTRDPLIAETSLRLAVEGARAAEACRSIAARADDAVVRHIELRSQVHDLRRHGSGADTLIADELVASCPVG